MRRSGLLLGIAAALMVTLPAVAGPEETYNLNIRAYCAPGTYCGFGSEEAYQQHVLDIVNEVNVIWQSRPYPSNFGAPVGISFRPVIHPIEDDDALWYMTTGCNEEDARNPWMCADLSGDCDGEDDESCPGSTSCILKTVCADLTTLCQQGPNPKETPDPECGQFAEQRCLLWNHHTRVKWNREVADEEPQGISMMITKGPNRCCGDQIGGVFCDANGDVPGGGSLWAHELGHAFCLSHTFTKEDYAETFPNLPNHDGDHLNVNDTPPDPCATEDTDLEDPRCNVSNDPCENDSDCGAGDSCNLAIFRDNHEACTITEHTGEVDDDSPHQTTCTSNCFRCINGPCDDHNDYMPLNEDPDEHAAISYWGRKCRGPHIINGVPREAFSPGSRQAIDVCRATARAALDDACQFRGGDSDYDGICNIDDNCTQDGNTDQLDSDYDLDGDVCDLCPHFPGYTGDMDGDGIGDVCDPDRDGDGCTNYILPTIPPDPDPPDPTDDQHPDDKMIWTGRVIGAGTCSPGIEEIFTDESTDSDGDGVPNCRDWDDDDDKICDENGPFTPNGARGIPTGCTPGDGLVDSCPIDADGGCIVDGAPNECPPRWLSCIGGGCDIYFLRITSVSNPDPTRDLVFDRMQIYNRTIFLTALPGRTASETARAIAGKDAFTPSGLAEAPGDLETLRIELWKDGGTAPEEIVVGDFTSNRVNFGDLSRGSIVSLKPTPGARLFAMTVETVSSIGERAGIFLDTDKDLRPDNMDNCRNVPNDLQTDGDRDGIGNPCDADLDQDGRVTQADVDAVTSCLGADLSLEMPISEPEEIGGFDQHPPDPIQLDLAYRCPPSDLNDDGFVDANDVLMAEGLRNLPPGPSGRFNFRPFALAGPDKEVGCGETFGIDGTASYDPEGSFVSCTWTSSSCEISNPTSCRPLATCPDGVHDLTLVVSDGWQASTPDTVRVTTLCPGPGRIEAPILLRKLKTGKTRVTWEASCSSEATDYAVYEGTIGDWNSHVPLTCSMPVGGALAFDFIPSAGSRYYLVVPRSEGTEGSYGIDSSGAERPPSEEACAPAQNVTACP